MCSQRKPLVQLNNIEKSFPGVKALGGVCFDVYPGEVHALVGENGAGKSTLVKILGGALRKDAGEVVVDGVGVEMADPACAMSLGIGVIHQELNVVPYLNVAENIFLGHLPRRSALGLVDRKELEARAGEILSSLKVELETSREGGSLSIAEQQMVEIARALSRESRVLVMDEPSASLSSHELWSLFEIIRALREKGAGIIYISHRLEEVFEIADRVTVLRDGIRISTRKVEETDRRTLIKEMVGREIREEFPARPPGKSAVVLLKVENISRGGEFKNITFELHEGEVLGMTGLVGSGRTEVAKAIFGERREDEGRILLMGQEVVAAGPRKVIRQGISLLSEDRKREGLVLSMSLRENVTLANLGKVSRWGFIKKRKEEEAAEEYIRDLRIATPDTEQLARNLSGGNQQKLVLAKWLFSDCKIIIADEPTRGVDVGAKYEIYTLINRLAARGMGVLLISSELPEVMGMCDRIIVMHEGEIKATLDNAERQVSQETIMELATGGEG